MKTYFKILKIPMKGIFFQKRLKAINNELSRDVHPDEDKLLTALEEIDEIDDVSDNSKACFLKLITTI